MQGPTPPLVQPEASGSGKTSAISSFGFLQKSDAEKEQKSQPEFPGGSSGGSLNAFEFMNPPPRTTQTFAATGGEEAGSRSFTLSPAV